MEKVIGIFDEKTVYAERFKHYVNERRDIGCFAVSFSNEQDLLNYCAQKKLSYLITGEVLSKRLNELSVPYGIRIWVLSEEEPEEIESEERNYVFRYQSAGEIIRQILLSEEKREERLSELFTVISPESSRMAEEYAERLAARLAEKGKTLFLPWDPFGGYGRVETGDGPSISELLYYIRKDRGQARHLFTRLCKKNGAEYFCGPEFCTDLWQYSTEEMQQLILCCREYGGYKQVVFLAGAFHEGVVAVMKQSGRICLVSSDSPAGEQRKQEFYRQMKYAGEQEILSKLTEVSLSGGTQYE